MGKGLQAVTGSGSPQWGWESTVWEDWIEFSLSGPRVFLIARKNHYTITTRGQHHGVFPLGRKPKSLN